MPDTLESIKEMYEQASADERDKYLFKALQKINEDMKSGFSLVGLSIKDMKNTCAERKVCCKKTFMTKLQAKIFGFLFLAFAIGVGIGTGLITWSELAKRAIP